MSFEPDFSPDGQREPNRRQSYRRQEDRKLLRRDLQLEAVRSVCLSLFQQTKLDLLIEGILGTALEVMNATEGSILLADAATKTLVFRHVISEKGAILRGTSMPWNEGIAGAVFTSGKAEIVNDAKQDPRHFPKIDEITGTTTRDIILMPLQRWNGERIGVLTILNKREGRLSEDDAKVLAIFAALSAELIEQARLYEEAKLAEVGRMVGDIAHDINNMLQPVVSVARLLREELSDHLEGFKEGAVTRAKFGRELYEESGPILDHSVKRIKDRLKEIGDCIKGLSTLPTFAPCQITGVANEVVKTLSGFAGAKNITIRTEGLDALPAIMADERRLYNAFYNLVNNAIPEVPPGGTIRIGGYEVPERQAVLLWVADTGQGMTREVLNSLFTPRVISRKDGGTGLGTKIVKDVVDAHRGYITVESEEGRGTTFYLHLPKNPLSSTSAQMFAKGGSS